MQTTRAPLIALIILILGLMLLSATPQQKTSKADTAAEAARLNNLGSAYMNQQLFEKALNAFQQASKLDPKLVTARLNQAVALLNLQRVDEAKKLLLEVTQTNVKDPHAWYNLGLLNKNSGEPRAAVDDF